MSFTVQQETFEGPLDLLLQLIQKEELDITTISLSKVTEQYLARVAELQRENIPEISDFLVIAARLLLIKSRVLLATETDTEEAEEDNLAAQLAEYKLYKELADQLGEGMEAGLSTFGREPEPFTATPQLVTDGVELGALHQAFSELVAGLPEDTVLPEQGLEEQLTIEECIASVKEQVARKAQPFAALFRSLKSRVAMIVTFLAILELVKQRTVKISMSKQQLMVAAR